MKPQTSRLGDEPPFRQGFLVDRAPAAREERAGLADVTEPLKGRRVLVVEDSEDNRLLVKLLLIRRGMSVDFAENGQVAVEIAPKGGYDFVLMDMQMPVKDGYAATRELRDGGYQGPILALTAHAMKEDRGRCIEAGCDDYLTKPIDSKALYSALVRYADQADSQKR